MERRPELERKVLRGAVLAALALTIAVIAFAALPNYELRTVDEPHALVATRTGLEPWLLYALAILLAPGLLVWCAPRLLTAALWAPLALFAGLAMTVVTFKLELDWQHDVVTLWPAQVDEVLFLVLAGGVLLAVPLACIGYGIATRRRPPAPPTLPTARVIT